MATKELLLPDIGDFEGVEVIEVLVAPGDRIEPEQELVTLESDKATMPIPASDAGTVTEVRVKVGDRISQGDVIAVIELAGGNAAAEAPVEAPASEPGPTAAASAPEPTQPAAVAAAKGETQRVDVLLPDVGDFADIPVIEVLVAVGDQVELEQPLVTLESDKATMEIPSNHAGKVESLAVSVGDKLNQGDKIATLLAEVASAEPEQRVQAEEAAAQAPAPATKSGARAPGEKEHARAPVLPRPEDMQAIARGRSVHASPSVRRFARELGVDLKLVKGSGRKGRVVKDDVQGYVKQALARSAAGEPGSALPFSLPSAPEIDYRKFGDVEVTELPRIKRISGAHLHRCWISVPHVTQFDEADITELEAFRKSQKAAAEAKGVKLTFLPLLIKAVAVALDQMPLLKASLTGDGQRLIQKRFTHIGVAVDTPNGLMVPVVRDVDQKGVLEIAKELMELSGKARDGKLLAGDMQGGCFSISSLGGIGGTCFTPIVNAPEAAILGVSRSQMKPVWNGSEFEPRLMLPLSLSYDHRIVDGADGARFTALLGRLLADIRQLLL